MIRLLFSVCFGLLSIVAFSQITNKDAKAIEKSIKFYEEKKYDKAVEKLAPILKNNKFNNQLWDLNIEYYFRGYMQERASLNSIAQILENLESDDENSEALEITVSTNSMFSVDAFLEQCAINSRLIFNAQMANIYLRSFLVDTPVDTAISEEAQAFFNEAEVEFQKKNFSKAIEKYSQALEIEPNFYKASLFLGDCHWTDGRPEKALSYFKEAIKKQPNLLQPRKYVTDAYIDLGEMDKAYKACINGIIVYPDGDMFRRMEEICKNLGKEFEHGWIPRDFLLNAVDKEQANIEAIPWNYYREAKTKIEPYCDERGVIVKQNNLTNQKYMEAYCWEYMLKNTKDEQFEFARKAMNSGYLDCYTLISMYHITLHDQFEDFSMNNSTKIHDYFDLILTSDQ